MEYESTEPFKYIELFAGIGGFRQALDSAGGECVFASEIDKFAQQSYTALYGDDHLHGDITQVDEKDVPDHDVMVYGFPCQAFSVAGKRGGFSDARGTLFFEAARIANEKRPKVLLAENVKGLVGHDGGKTLDSIILALNEIGYTVDFDVLNSKYFGVPQNRERIFIVAVRDDLVAPEPWRIEGTNVVAKGKRRIAEIDGVKTFNFEYPTQGEVTVRLRDILEDDVDERYYLSEEKTAKLVAQLRDDNPPIENGQIRPVLTPDRTEKRQNGRRFKDDGEEAFTLTAQDRHGVVVPGGESDGGEKKRNATEILCSLSGEIGEETFTKWGLRVLDTFQQAEILQQRMYEDGFHIKEGKEQQRREQPEQCEVEDEVFYKGHQLSEMRLGEEFRRSPQGWKPIQQRTEQLIIDLSRLSFERTQIETMCNLWGEAQGIGVLRKALSEVQKVRKSDDGQRSFRIRKLTPKECFRLQGFSDLAHETVKLAGVSDSQRYKQAGNAVTVNVIDALMPALLTLLTSSKREHAGRVR